MERRVRRQSWRRPLTWLAGACALIGLTASALAVAAYRTPVETERIDAGMTISQRGKYDWTASLAPNHLYDVDKVSDEAMIYTGITRALNMEFSFQISARGATALRGTYSIDLVIRADDSWSKRIPLVGARQFAANGDTAAFWTQYTLDLGRLNELVDQIVRETGVAGNAYSLIIQPDVSTSVIGMRTTREVFAAPLELRWSGDRRQISMPVQREFVSETTWPIVTKVPGKLILYGVSVSVSSARRWSVPIGTGGLCLATSLGILARPRRSGAAKLLWLQRKYRHLFVEGRERALPPLPIVEMHGIEQLLKVARGFGKPVVRAGSTDVYYVVDSGVVYTYDACDDRGIVAHTAPDLRPVPVPRRQRRQRAVGA